MKLTHIALVAVIAATPAQAHAFSISKAWSAVTNYFTQSAPVLQQIDYRGPMPRPASIGGIRYSSQPSTVRELLTKAKYGDPVRQPNGTMKRVPWDVDFKQGYNGTLSTWTFTRPDGTKITKSGTKTWFYSDGRYTTSAPVGYYDAQGVHRDGFPPDGSPSDN